MRVAGLILAWAACLAAFRVSAQTPSEHASHHPGGTGAGIPATAPGSAATAPGGGGMTDQMGEMMKGMMGPPSQKEIYPTLMALPALTSEQRAAIEQQARVRMEAGLALMNESTHAMSMALSAHDLPALQEHSARLREGLGQFESGVSALRALAEGRAPREIALTWFKREMSLLSPPASEDLHSARGLSPLHVFTMVLLVAFAAAMLAMYFYKMRRAAALFGRIEPGSGKPPPGSSPPLGGGPGPSAPAGGKTPQAGGSSQLSVLTGAPGTSLQRPDGSTIAVSPSNEAAPLKANWAGRLRVERIDDETPSVRTFRLRSPEGGALPFTFTPGQFLNVAFGIGGARMNRSYSISSSPNERAHIDLTVKREERGAVSRHVFDLLRVADEVEAGGPVGKFTFTGTEAESVVLIGAGVGITPMISVARYLTEQAWPGEIFFIYGCRSPSDLIFGKAIAALELRNPKLRVGITMSKPTPDWKGPRGRISKEFLLQAVPDLALRRVQLCGPPTMMEEIKALLIEIGVSPENLKTEAFGAVKPPTAALGTSAKPTAAGTGPLVTFSQNNKAAKIHADQTILELSEELGIGIQYSCRVGTCGLCKVKMTAGEVDMAVDDALDDDDKRNGVILACQAKPKTEVTVEA